MRLVQVYYFRARQRQGSEHITHSTSHHITQSKSGSELQAYVQVMGLVMQPLGQIGSWVGWYKLSGAGSWELGRGRVLGGGLVSTKSQTQTQNAKHKIVVTWLLSVWLVCLS